MRRGEIWWASLPAPRGSAPGFRRPVLVVQANSFNDSRISTAVVAVITSNLALAQAPGNVRFSRRDSKLAKESVANVSQLITVDKSLLTERAGRISDKKMAEVSDGLRLVLGL